MAVPLEVHEPLCLSIKVSKTFLKTRSPAFRCPKIAWVAGLARTSTAADREAWCLHVEDLRPALRLALLAGHAAEVEVVLAEARLDDEDAGRVTVLAKPVRLGELDIAGRAAEPTQRCTAPSDGDLHANQIRTSRL